MQLVDVIRSLRRHWRASLAILVLAGTALGVFLFTRSEVRGEDRWLASVQLLVPARDEDGLRPEGVPPQLLQGQAAIAQSSETTGAALEAVGLDDSARSEVVFGFSASEGRDTLTLSATAAEVELAARLADAYASAYTRARKAMVADGAEGALVSTRQSLEALGSRLSEVETQLRAVDPALLPLLDGAAGPADEEGVLPSIDLPPGTPLDTVLLAYERQSLVNRINDTRRQYAATALDSVVPQAFATVVERPIPRQVTPELPSPLIPAAVALAVGLLLALAVPVLLDRLDHTIRDPRTAGNALAAPVLTTIPAVARANLDTLARPGSPRGSAYRALAATSIATDELPRAIVVTSPVGEVQDSVAANFAAALAGLGLRVALVATDPRQAWFLDDTEAEGVPTLPDLLTLAHAGRLNGQIRKSLVPTNIENLAVLAPGATGADALLDGFPPLLRELADAGVDVTVIAGPALLEEPAATILAWSTRSVLWVVEAGEVTDHEAREAASRLELAGATPFGVALVDARG